MTANGMARPRSAVNLLGRGREALSKAQGACDAHISSERTGNHQHDRNRRRQEHVPFGGARQAGCNRSAAKGNPSSAWTPNAIVISVDEKPAIQALERAQGYLKLPNGRTLTGHSHDYKRNGTTTLFAAFEVATGKVTAAHKKRRRRVEFLDFMNDIVAAFPDRTLHVILDNLNTHK